MVFPFIRMQHAHFCCKHAFASSCLQIEHMQTSFVITSILFCCFDLTSTYNHNATSGKPIAKNTMIVLIGTRKTNSDIPKHNVPMPRTKTQRVAVSIFSPIAYIAHSSLIASIFYLISLWVYIIPEQNKPKSMVICL